MTISMIGPISSLMRDVNYGQEKCPARLMPQRHDVRAFCRAQEIGADDRAVR